MKQVFKPLYFMSFCCISFLLVNCQQEKKEEQEVFLPKSYSSSARFGDDDEFKKAIEDHEKKIKFKDFSFKGVDAEMIKRESKNCRSDEDAEKLYTKAGMKNAKAYVASIKKQHMALIKQMKQNPEMEKWSAEQKRAYLKSIFQSSKSL